MSNLSASEQAEHLGLYVSKEELAATEEAIKAVESMQATFSAEAFAAPTAIDWRNNGGDYTTSIKNQQSCGSCVSFATLATIESRMNIACKSPNLDPIIQKRFFFIAVLELALSSLGEGENLSAEEALEFASVASSSNIGLEDIVSLTEQYPGLKITFSQ